MWNDALESFLGEGLIDEVLYPMKSGKEATVWVCLRGPRSLAAKVYKPRAARGFRNDAPYRAGRVVLDDRLARAVAGKTRFGMDAAETMWVGHEYSTLRALHHAGVDVPEPVARGETAVLMGFVGDEAGEPAPLLRNAEIDGDARPIFERIMWNIEMMLSIDVVHADLSPFNVLVHEGRPVLIDFPQAVDPRSNPNARSLLFRDVENVCRWAVRHGIEADGFAIADDLGARWERALL